MLWQRRASPAAGAAALLLSSLLCPSVLLAAAPSPPPSSSLALTREVPLTGSFSIAVPVAPGGERALRGPADVFEVSLGAWTALVEPAQAGLVDAKASHLMSAPLAPAEAWHHHQAIRAGVVDSARLLLAFAGLVFLSGFLCFVLQQI